MSTILFRASKAGELLTEAAENKPLTTNQVELVNELLSKNTRTDKQSGELARLLEKEANSKLCLLSKSAESFVEEIWLKNEFGYEEVLHTDEILKGRLCEQDAMDLLYKVDGTYRPTFKKSISNEYVKGTPDIVITLADGTKVVEDTKCSFTIKTFRNAELTSIYETQLRVYMWLTGATKARLQYCLVQTPEEIIQEEVKRFYFKFGCNEESPDFIAAEAQIRANHDISMIPLEKRIKTFEVIHDDAIIERLKLKIEKAREYYLTLAL